MFYVPTNGCKKQKPKKVIVFNTKSDMKRKLKMCNT